MLEGQPGRRCPGPLAGETSLLVSPGGKIRDGLPHLLTPDNFEPTLHPCSYCLKLALPVSETPPSPYSCHPAAHATSASCGTGATSDSPCLLAAPSPGTSAETPAHSSSVPLGLLLDELPPHRAPARQATLSFLIALGPGRMLCPPTVGSNQ